MRDFDLDMTGKVALVTGGSRGLGHAVTTALARKGAEVVICGRKQENLDQAVEGFKSQGLDIMGVPAHVAKSDQVTALLGAIEDRFGRLDVLINNVGMNILTPSVADMDEGLWAKIIETNLTGTFIMSAKAVSLMKKGGRGKIVNITSTAAKKAARGMGVYSIAKAGVEMLTRVLAVELASDHINVNAVAPSMIKTSFSQPFWRDDKLLKEVSRMIPMGRIAETEDVVGAVLFLSSGLSDFITGEILTVDGGAMA